MPKNADKFSCKICDFSCSKRSNWSKHLLTRKHNLVTNKAKKMPKDASTGYECECGKKYKHRQNLYTHKKKCNYEEEIEEKEEEPKNIDYEKIITGLVNENKDLHKTMREMIPTI